jgi:hypothetical protein
MNATSASAGGMCSASDCAAGFVIGLEMVEVRDAATLNGLYQAVDEAAAARRVGAAVIGEGVPSPPPLRIAADHEWQLLAESGPF